MAYNFATLKDNVLTVNLITYEVRIPVTTDDLKTALEQAIGYAGIHLNANRVKGGRKRMAELHRSLLRYLSEQFPVPDISDEELLAGLEDEPRVTCDSCQLLSINGVTCHEIGCPNMHARYDAETGEWIKQRKCFECGCTVDADDPCCNAPFEDDSEDIEDTEGE